MIRILGFLFLLLVMRSASAEPVQWTVADGGNGHWYEAIDIGSTDPAPLNESTP